jgi:hypothetical protein
MDKRQSASRFKTRADLESRSTENEIAIDKVKAPVNDEDHGR